MEIKLKLGCWYQFYSEKFKGRFLGQMCHEGKRHPQVGFHKITNLDGSSIFLRPDEKMLILESSIIKGVFVERPKFYEIKRGDWLRFFYLKVNQHLVGQVFDARVIEELKKQIGLYKLTLMTGAHFPGSDDVTVSMDDVLEKY